LKQRSGQIVAGSVSDKVYVAAVVVSASRLKDGEHLSFCNHIVDAHEDGFDFASGGRGNRDLHLHGFDEGNVVAIADASAGFNGKRANAPGDFGHNPDFWHSFLRQSRRAQS
jgi:hypothetical protein